MDLAVPFVGLFYGTQVAEIIDFQNQFLDLGFSAKHLKLLTKKQLDLLKPIEGGFYNEKNAKGEEALAQLLLDDNLFNSIFSIFLSVDKMFSLRDLTKGNQKAAPFLQMLTTSTIGAVLPQFVEEYGAGKKIDVVFSPSHEFFLDGFPNSKMSGIYMDKNGNWKFMANVALQLNVESLPGMWDPVRNVFFTVQFKFKMTVTEQDGDKFLNIIPKNLELTKLKVLKGEGQEEVEMEQMMIQSMANIQLEQVKKMLTTQSYSVNKLLSRAPKELQCFGFKLSDADLSFKKGQA